MHLQGKIMESATLYQYQPAAYLRVSGDDSATFLQSQFSNELRPFDARRCVYGLWLSAKGKVMADSWVLNRAETHFEVVSRYTEAATLKAKIEEHIIADDVEVEVLAAAQGITFVGATAAECLHEYLGALPEAEQVLEAKDILCFAGQSGIEPVYECIFSDSKLCLQAKESFLAKGVLEGSVERMHETRIGAGHAIVPQELGSSDMPGEAGLVGSLVCTTKGCFLGQESILRLHNLGQARRGLYAISGSGALPKCPAKLSSESSEKPPGELRSAYSKEGNWFGVAMLKLNRLEENLQCEGLPIKVEKSMGYTSEK
jgi:folate-binding protein YgfZ